MIPLKIEVTRRYKMHPITNSVSICYLIYECITDFAYCKLCFQTFFILMHDICHAMSCFVCTSLNVMQSDRLPFTQRLCRLFLFICTGTFKSFTVVFVPAFFKPLIQLDQVCLNIVSASENSSQAQVALEQYYDTTRLSATIDLQIIACVTSRHTAIRCVGNLCELFISRRESWRILGAALCLVTIQGNKQNVSIYPWQAPSGHNYCFRLTVFKITDSCTVGLDV